jgi:hypothetical protein
MPPPEQKQRQSPCPEEIDSNLLGLGHRVVWIEIVCAEAAQTPRGRSTVSGSTRCPPIWSATQTSISDFAAEDSAYLLASAYQSRIHKTRDSEKPIRVMRQKSANEYCMPCKANLRKLVTLQIKFSVGALQRR